jgi:hypothetical protein
MGLFAALLPSALGIIGSLFKGKKTENAAQGTPQQNAAYAALLRMIQQRMGQPSAGTAPTQMAMNNLSNMFYGQNAIPQQNPVQQQPGRYAGGAINPAMLRRPIQ